MVWASVDSSLFLWSVDGRAEVPLEYSGEGQLLRGVGLLRPAPGVFVEAVGFCVVVCTVVEVVMLALCRTALPAAAAATDIPVQRWELRALPHYTAPSNAVAMRCVACTPGGRALLGGGDGRIYELDYQSAASWSRRRCSLRALTGSLRSLLPSFLPSMLPFVRQPAALVQLAVDPARGALYARAEDSRLQVYDLGAQCELARPERVGEVGDLREAASHHTADGAALLKADTEERQKRRCRVLHMAVIPPGELDRPALHLMVVTADGTRCYLSSRATDYPPAGPQGMRANALRVRLVQAPPQRPGSAFLSRASGPLALVGLQQSHVDVMEVSGACYHRGDTLLAVRAGEDTQLVVGRCEAGMALMATASGVLGKGPVPSTKEPENVEGPAAALVALDPPPTEAEQLLCSRTGSRALHAAGEALHAQMFTRPSQFLLLTKEGALKVGKRRAVDVLRLLLEAHMRGDRQALDRIRDLVEALTLVESAVLFLTLGTQTGERHRQQEGADGLC